MARGANTLSGAGGGLSAGLVGRWRQGAQRRFKTSLSSTLFTSPRLERSAERPGWPAARTRSANMLSGATAGFSRHRVSRLFGCCVKELSRRSPKHQLFHCTSLYETPAAATQLLPAARVLRSSETFSAAHLALVSRWCTCCNSAISDREEEEKAAVTDKQTGRAPEEGSGG